MRAAVKEMTSPRIDCHEGSWYRRLPKAALRTTVFPGWACRRQMASLRALMREVLPSAEEHHSDAW